MQRRIVSSLLLSLWLLLVGVELAEELGFFDFDDSAVAHAMDGIVISFWDAFQTDDYVHPLKSVFPVLSLALVDSRIFEPVTSNGPLLEQAALAIKTTLSIFKLHRAFLI
jgi:hypothetical protein